MRHSRHSPARRYAPARTHRYNREMTREEVWEINLASRRVLVRNGLLPREFALSDKQWLVAELIALGLSYKQIAERSGIAAATVKGYASHPEGIYKLLGVGSQGELIRYWVVNVEGLLKCPKCRSTLPGVLNSAQDAETPAP